MSSTVGCQAHGVVGLGGHFALGRQAKLLLAVIPKVERSDGWWVS
jgi:hypothetical protein